MFCFLSTCNSCFQFYQKSVNVELFNCHTKQTGNEIVLRLINTTRERDQDRYRERDYNRWVLIYCTEMLNIGQNRNMNQVPFFAIVLVQFPVPVPVLVPWKSPNFLSLVHIQTGSTGNGWALSGTNQDAQTWRSVTWLHRSGAQGQSGGAVCRFPDDQSEQDTGWKRGMKLN